MNLGLLCLIAIIIVTITAWIELYLDSKKPYVLISTHPNWHTFNFSFDASNDCNYFTVEVTE